MKALVFPGQGSQSVGMGRFLFDEFACVRSLFEEASDLNSLDYKNLIFEDPRSELNLTENTQPALVLSSTAYFLALKENFDLKFDYCAGHSLGEYSALVASEAMEFSFAIKAVKHRGSEMQKAVPAGEGGMLAVMGLETETVLEVCKWVEEKLSGSVLSVANYNAPGQIVISGSKAACDWLIGNFEPENFGSPKRFKFIPLKVSAPFHCRMMEPARLAMSSYLDNTPFQTPKVPIIQNVNAVAVSAPEELKKNLTEQVSKSVLWTDSVKELKALGVSEIYELGPGKVLSGLVKKIDSEAFKTFNMQNLEEYKTLGENLSRP